MKLFHTITTSLIALTILGCAEKVPINSAQNMVDNIAENLQVNYAVTHNKWGETCALPNGTGTFSDNPCYEANLTFNSEVNLYGANWEIYYSQVEPIFAVQSEDFTIERINGDLHRIRPTNNFSGFKSDAPITINLVALGQVLTEAKLMPNYYVVADGADAKTIESTRLKTDPETGLISRPYITPLDDTASLFSKSKDDNTALADAGFLYTANQDILAATETSIDLGIIPAPLSITPDINGGRLEISLGINITTNVIARPQIETALDRLAMLGVKENKNGAPVNLVIKPNANNIAGSYSLVITDSSIDITGTDIEGVYYGLMTVASLTRVGSTTIPAVRIEDAPRYGFRGMHVDVGRNFHSKEELIRIMDQMAAYKLNKLHLHLADDEGWRLEISGLPELTDIGSKRCHDPREDTCLLMQLGSGPTGTSGVDGYYSVADYTEILQAASARHIEVIPSLDMPGHARAAVKSMEARYRKYMALGDSAKANQYLLSDPNDKSEYQSIQFYSDNTINPCMESSFVFLEKMTLEVKKMHDEAGHPLKRYHIGADETAGAWTASPICEAFFKDNTADVTKPEHLGNYLVERMANMLASHGILAAAWNDGLEHADPKKLPKNLQSNIWGVLSWGGTTPAHKHANYGWDAVLSYPNALYFDFPHEADPKEGGYYWASRHVNTRKVFNIMPGNSPIHAEFEKDTNENPFEVNDTLQKDKEGNITHAPLNQGTQFAGIQGQIWSETVSTDGELEYRVFPRFLALAERAWHKPTWEVPYNYEGGVYNQNSHNFTDKAKAQRDLNWAQFATLIGNKEMRKLDEADIAYRIPTVGAIIENGTLKANIIFPGLAIEYREDGKKWIRYQDPVSVNDTIEIRARSANGERAGRSLTVTPSK